MVERRRVPGQSGDRGAKVGAASLAPIHARGYTLAPRGSGRVRPRRSKLGVDLAVLGEGSGRREAEDDGAAGLLARDQRAALGEGTDHSGELVLQFEDLPDCPMSMVRGVSSPGPFTFNSKLGS